MLLQVMHMTIRVSLLRLKSLMVMWVPIECIATGTCLHFPPSILGFAPSACTLLPVTIVIAHSTQSCTSEEHVLRYCYVLAGQCFSADEKCKFDQEHDIRDDDLKAIGMPIHFGNLGDHLVDHLVVKHASICTGHTSAQSAQ